MIDETHNWRIEAYLQGRLSEAEAAEFEEAYLADPALLEALELAAKLRQGFAEVESVPAPVAAARPAFWATPQYAVAASTLLAAFAVVSGLLFVQNQSLQQGGRDSAPALPGTTRVLQLVAVRGDSGMTIEPAASNEWTVLLADPGFSDFERFDATLTRQPPAGAENGTVVWQAEGLTASFDGFVPVGVPGERLVPGRYALTLQGRSGAAAPETVSLYRFEIDASTP